MNWNSVKPRALVVDQYLFRMESLLVLKQRSNHLVTSFRLEMNVGCFSKHQKTTSDTDRYKGCLFIAGVSQVNLNTMKKNLEQSDFAGLIL